MATKDLRINDPAENNIAAEVVDAIEIDFGRVDPSRPGVTFNLVTGTDTGRCALPKKKLIITDAYAVVKTAEGSACTIDVGDTDGGATTIFSNLNCNSVALTNSSVTPVLIDNSSADKYITISPDHNCSAAVVTIYLTYIIADR